MGKLEFRRMRFQKERKKKLQLFYYEVRCYFEDAYKEFELKFLAKRDEHGIYM
jgi:hypothetical protein